VTSQSRSERGILIALEGIDGSGKSTQATSTELATTFTQQGYEVVSFHEPSDSPWGRRIREMKRLGTRLLAPSQELDLFLRDRRYDVVANIEPALAAHKVVLMDRYYFSTMAYQGALGIDPEHIQRLNEAFAPIPDLVFILLISPAAALQRIRHSRGQPDNVFELEAYLKHVDAIFRTLKGPHIHFIPADQPVATVTAMLRRKIAAFLHS
jgi:dTMP kinase